MYFKSKSKLNIFRVKHFIVLIAAISTFQLSHRAYIGAPCRLLSKKNRLMLIARIQYGVRYAGMIPSAINCLPLYFHSIRESLESATVLPMIVGLTFQKSVFRIPPEVIQLSVGRLSV